MLISYKLFPLDPLVNMCLCFNPLSFWVFFILDENGSGYQGFTVSLVKAGKFFLKRHTLIQCG